jgi:hypothetical protein
MTTLSSAAWVVHDAGLATAIGGSLFGRAALEPALAEISDPGERDRVSTSAWNRFSWLNLAAHVAFAVPWFIGRSLRSGSEVSGVARALTCTKDVLVGASLITGVGTHLVGRKIKQRTERDQGPERERAQPGRQTSRGLERTVGALGMFDMIVNVGILGVTALLAMEAGKSVRFAVSSRSLP